MAAAALAVLFAGGLGCSRSQADPGLERPFSLIAVGDTGTPASAVSRRDPQRVVARALEDADREAPVTGLLLLGDNFYPDGLKERKFKDRVRENLVAPYCRFLHLTGRGRGSMEDDCPVAEDERRQVPFYAVLGNHDYGQRESPMLQRDRIPEYVKNWTMPEGQAALHELPGGVSLILFDSVQIVRGEGPSQVADALKRSKGPWRILAAHHPIADAGDGFEERYAQRLRGVIADAGQPVHLFLAGHVHSLQALTGAGTGAALHVIAGSGSNPKELADAGDQRRFAASELGFARIDLEERAGEDVLIVSLITVEPTLLGSARSQQASRFVISQAGEVGDDSTAVAAAAP